MEEAIANLRANNPHFAETLTNEFNNTIGLLKQQYQIQIDQQVNNYNQLLENHNQLQAGFDEIKTQNGDLIKQIAKLTSEMSKLTYSLNDGARPRKVPNSQGNRRDQNIAINEKQPNSIETPDMDGIDDSNLGLASSDAVNSKAHANNSTGKKNNNDNITSNVNDGANKNSSSNKSQNTQSVLGKMKVIENSNTSDWQMVDKKKKKSKNIQPIIVELGETTSHSIRNLLHEHVGHVGYTIQQFHLNGPLKILPDSVEIRKQIMDCLSDNNLGYSSFNNGDEKKKCYILRGIIADYDPNTIRKTLIDSGLFPNDIVVLKHITGYQRLNPDKHHNTLYHWAVT